jgi:hypothetical protein
MFVDINLKNIWWTILFMSTLSGCQTVYYGTMEKFGQHKRDILVDRIENARDSQEEAKVQFNSALEEFSAVLKFKGGSLEDKYKKMDGIYKESNSKAENVHDRIASVERVAEALFEEWEAELDEYTDAKLRRSSATKLNQTKKKYGKLIQAMKRAEGKIQPVLSAFKNQVLFLKHNLNAKAIASLQNDLVSIETDVAKLIKEMEIAIAEANTFLKTIEN